MKNKLYVAICLILAIIMILPIAACSKKETDIVPMVTTKPETTETTAEETSEETTEAEIVETSEETTEPETEETTEETTESETLEESSEETTEETTEETVSYENPDKIEVNDMDKYSIVRANNASGTVKNLSTSLAKSLELKWNCELKAKPDTLLEGVPQYSESPYEILIGKTNRKESVEFLEKLGKYDYGYTVTNKKIVIGGKTDAAVEKSIELFMNNIIDKKGFNGEFYMEKGDELIGVADLTQTPLKVMSINVQVWEQTETRYAGVVKEITDNMPDSFGVQEADGKWMDVLTTRLADNYAYVGIGRDNNSSSEHSAVFYNKNKFEVVSSGTKWLTATPDVPSQVATASQYKRIVTYAVLKRKADGFIYIHANTHLDHQSAQARTDQVGHLINILSELPDYPMLLTGDFNATSSEQAFSLIGGAGFANAASRKMSGDVDTHVTYHGYAEGGSVIDFCFVGNTDFLTNKYKVLDEVVPADHYALYFELIPW